MTQATPRLLLFGVLPPRSVVQHKVDSEIGPTECPVVLTKEGQDVRIKEHEATTVTVENVSDHTAGYIVLVLPKTAAKVFQLPWQAALTMLSSPQGRVQTMNRLAHVIMERLHMQMPPGWPPGQQGR